MGIVNPHRIPNLAASSNNSRCGFDDGGLPRPRTPFERFGMTERSNDDGIKTLIPILQIMLCPSRRVIRYQLRASARLVGQGKVGEARQIKSRCGFGHGVAQGL